MEEIRCIFCDIESSQVVIEENGYKGRKCPQCGLIYISPRPAFNEIVDVYTSSYANMLAEYYIDNTFLKRLHARHSLRTINSVVKTGALLEIGPGAGYFLDEARRIGFDPYGVELNLIQANFLRNELKIPCEQSPLSTSIFHGKKFDVVYHCDVISHLFDPISDFRTINTIMHDDAFLIFETGNLGEIDPFYFKYYDIFQYPDHLFFFNTDTLSRLLDISGFNLLKLYRYSIVFPLLLDRLLAAIKNVFLRLNGKQSNSYPSTGARKTAVDIYKVSKSPIVKMIVRHLLDYLNYVLCYKLGHIKQKDGRPQTMIVIAQKRKTG